MYRAADRAGGRMKHVVALTMCTIVGAAAAGDGLLVVAPEAFCASLDPFIAFKQERLETELATLESVLEHGKGTDDAEKLKRFIYQRWREKGIGFVLLVGDADVMPMRYMVLDRNTEAAFHYAMYPSDLYYADVATEDGTFECWNARAENFHAGYFGEVRGEHFKDDPINFDQIDYVPELGVGRWPVSTPEAVRLVAEKTMRYERGFEHARAAAAGAGRSGASGAGDWPFRAGLVMVGGWVDARPRFEQWRELLERRFAVERRYDRGHEYDVPAPDAEQVVELINSGVGLLLHAGHGSDETWDQCIGTVHLAELDNADRLAVVMSAGCSTARFATLPPYEPYEDIFGNAHAGTDHGQVFGAPPPPPAIYARGVFNRTGLGEQLVVGTPNGAVAYIGCNTGSQPCALTLQEGLVRAIASRDHPRLGECWKDAVAYYCEQEHLATITPTESWYPASVFFQAMKFMVFGDPSIPVGQ